jgi:cysteine desulfurase / selenocysteine lyase
MPFFPEAPAAPAIQPLSDTEFPAWFAEYRASIPNLRKFRYMNHASVGPLSTWVVDAASEMFAHQTMAETCVQDAWFDGWRLVRQRAGELVGGVRQDVSLHTSTYDAMMRAFQSLPLGSGDEAVCSADEFPSLYHALSELRRRGVRVIEAQSARGDGIVRLQDVLDALTPRTKLVAVSWVNFFHGYRMDLAALGAACKDIGAWLLVDGIQALGASFFDMRAAGVHFFACNGAKWMCAPIGSGFLYVSPDVPAEISPQPEGWFSLELNHLKYTDRTVKPKTNANRFGTGTVALPCAFGMRRAAEVFLTVGTERCEALAFANADAIDAAATEADIPVFSDRRLPDGGFGQQRSPIVSLEVSGRPEIEARLRERNVVFSVREGKLRLSPHWYQTEDELGPVLEVLTGR